MFLGFCHKTFNVKYDEYIAPSLVSKVWIENFKAMYIILVLKAKILKMF